MKIAVIGLWHLGEVYSICLAKLGNKVIGIDLNKEYVEDISNGKLPLFEPDLFKLLEESKKNNKISFTTDLAIIASCSFVWVTIDTSVDKKDNAKLGIIFENIERALPFIKNNTTIVISSQIGLGASQRIIDFIKKKRPKLKFEYAYVPENLRIGESVKGFFKPTKIVIGTNSKKTFTKIRRIFRGLKTEFLYMSPSSAEMVKEATNSYLATSLAFIFDIADLCEKVGANIIDVVEALRLDHRIGKNAYLGVSVGFSGATLGRALRYLMKKSTELGIKLPVINAVWRKNFKRKRIITEKLLPLVKSFSKKRVAFYGLTYKGGVTTLRNSRALEIIKEIYNKGANIAIYDKNIKEIDLKKNLIKVPFEYFDNPYDAAAGCHCLVFITPSKNLLRLNFNKLKSKTRNPEVFFDTQNFFYDKKKLISNVGFKYLGLGI